MSSEFSLRWALINPTRQDLFISPIRTRGLIMDKINFIKARLRTDPGLVSIETGLC